MNIFASILPDFFSSGWQLVQTAWNGVYAAIDVAWQTFFAIILGWIQQQFSPAYVVDAALTLLSFIVATIGSYIGGPLGSALINTGVYLDMDFTQRAYALGLFLASPVLDASVINLCLDGFLLVFVLSLLLRLALVVWGYAWSSGG